MICTKATIFTTSTFKVLWWQQETCAAWLLLVEALEPLEMHFYLLWYTKESDVSEPLGFFQFLKYTATKKMNKYENNLRKHTHTQQHQMQKFDEIRYFSCVVM